MQSSAEELEEKTRLYWEVSRCWSGFSNLNLNFSTAIRLVVDTKETINPERYLRKVMWQLENELIRDEATKLPTPAQLLELKAK